MSDEEIDLTSDCDSISSKASDVSETAETKYLKSTVDEFVAVILSRLKMIRSNERTDDILMVYLTDVSKKFEDVFVNEKKTYYDYHRCSYLALQLSSTGSEMGDPTYNESILGIKPKTVRFALLMKSIIAKINPKSYKAAVNWIDHQIVKFLQYTKSPPPTDLLAPITNPHN
ncbi:hypothetical protein HA402_011190 [Bradysia odoriphaga]|nr:hypothetical protein HA402_011190 [Bradysia odoriphaga]